MSLARKTTVLAVALLFLAATASIARADYREDFSKTAALKAGGTFSLENVNGSVRVSTWKEDKVEIKAVKVAKKREGDLKEVEILVDASEGRVMVKAVWPKFPRNVSVSVDFDVKVPEGVHVEEAGTVNGSVEITGRYGRLAAGTTNGQVSVEDASGDLEASTTNGGVRVRRFEGRVDARTTNGNVRLEGLTFKDGVEAKTTNGSIHLGIVSPEGLNADLNARTTNGSISVDFPVTLQNLRQSRRVVEARIGQGGPEISLRTTNGSITIGR
jgi:DUF4097 and DUF4098 domain-containing protein YvlB